MKSFAASKPTPGKEIWKDSLRSEGSDGTCRRIRRAALLADGDRRQSRDSRVNGTLSCYDAASGKKLWRNDDNKVPRLGSPLEFALVADGPLHRADRQRKQGGIIAYDLGTGAEKWKWSGDGTAYASPSLLTVDGTKVVVAGNGQKIVGLGLTDGKLSGKHLTPYRGCAITTRPRPWWKAKPSSTPDRAAVRKPWKIEKRAMAWSEKNSGATATTPCSTTRRSSKTACSSDCPHATVVLHHTETGTNRLDLLISGRQGYGTIVDAGPVLMALTPRAATDRLRAEREGIQGGEEIQSFLLRTYAYPVLSGNWIFVKDRDSLILWTLE